MFKKPSSSFQRLHFCIFTDWFGPIFPIDDLRFWQEFQCNSNSDINFLKLWLEISCQTWYFRFESFLCNSESIVKCDSAFNDRKNLFRSIMNYFLMSLIWFIFPNINFWSWLHCLKGKQLSKEKIKSTISNQIGTVFYFYMIWKALLKE